MAIERLFMVMRQDKLAKASTLSHESTQLLQEGNIRQAQDKQNEIDLVLGQVMLLDGVAAEVCEKLDEAGVPKIGVDWIASTNGKRDPEEISEAISINLEALTPTMRGTDMQKPSQAIDLQKQELREVLPRGKSSDEKPKTRTRVGKTGVEDSFIPENVDLEAPDFKVRLSQRNEKAFEELFHGFYKAALSHAIRFLNDYQEAEDVVQDVFMNVYKGVGSFDTEKRVGTWLFSILSHRCIDILRRKGVRKIITDSGLIDQAADIFVDNSQQPPDIAEENELNRNFVEILKKLPQQYSAPIALRVEGYTYEEIAEILDLPKSTVRMRLYKTRHSLLNKDEILAS